MRELLKYIFRPRKAILIGGTFSVIRKVRKTGNTYIMRFGFDDMVLVKNGNLVGGLSHTCHWRPISGWSEEELKKLNVNYD